jgi:hypothetical protein
MMNVISQNTSDFIFFVCVGCFLIASSIHMIRKSEVHGRSQVHAKRSVDPLGFWCWVGVFFLFGASMIFVGLRSISGRVAANKVASMSNAQKGG